MSKVKKILITGSNGLLGQKLVYNLKQRKDVELYATAIGENRLIDNSGYSFLSLDITDQNNVNKVIENVGPDVIINTAAMTNVDACELNKEACWKINVDAVNYLVEASLKFNSQEEFLLRKKNAPPDKTGAHL